MILRALRERKISIVELSAGLGAEDLRRLTNEMIDTMCDMIEGCTDADAVFVPDDADAHDAAAATEDELGMAWTLGHVIVHTTASSEEAAALATKLARGVTHRGGRVAQRSVLGNDNDHRAVPPPPGREPAHAAGQPGYVAGRALSGQYFSDGERGAAICDPGQAGC